MKERGSGGWAGSAVGAEPETSELLQNGAPRSAEGGDRRRVQGLGRGGAPGGTTQCRNLPEVSVSGGTLIGVSVGSCHAFGMSGSTLVPGASRKS